MRPKIVILIFAMAITIGDVYSQFGFEELIINGAKQPVPYYHLREADVIWSKKVWRMLDLKEKMNHPIYYPTDPIEKRVSLTDLIVYCVENNYVKAYSDDAFKNEMSVQDIYDKFDAGWDTVPVINPDTDEEVMQPIFKDIHSEEVSEILIKEEWFFNSKRGELDVRIIGICPIRNYTKEYEGIEFDNDEILKLKVCWIRFEPFRNVMANVYVFNPNNDTRFSPLSYDDYFFKRKFSSYIYQISNVYDDRRIGSYKMGIDAQLEAERLKMEIFNLEHDMWCY